MSAKAASALVTVDGSAGEGGGQVLRTSLALSLVTGRPVRIEKIRARRQKPGLMRQHLTAVEAAARIGCAHVEGASIGSSEILFTPVSVTPGVYEFAVGTAGSTTLVLQTVLPALLTASGPSTLRLRGGTHNPLAPPFEFLKRSFLPLVERMGPRVEANLVRAGFYPAGGGEIDVTITPVPRLGRLDLLERGEIARRRAVGVVARLPLEIAERETKTVAKALGWEWDLTETLEVDSAGPGNVVHVEIECANVTEVITGFGERGVRAEAVAEKVAREAKRYLAADVPVGEHLADQLLLPM
ncbi:MAG TPA: RNA 3'-terminal phosphate cyclase, partial [Thermoanaerobaculia bacterium]|nr:RNA 3'-terminal phosphate cyclase [Thermoanaerobaculia bacterium]